MATDLENLQARRSAICAELAALDTSKAGGKPNNPSGVDHQGYKQGLYDELKAINEAIAAATGDSDGPWEEFGVWIQ